MAKLSLSRVTELAAVATAKEGAFYEPALAQVIGKCHYIKPSSNTEYKNSFSGLVTIVDPETQEVVDVWVNFGPNQVDEDTPINKQLARNKRLPVIVEELRVSATAKPEDLITYKKKVGDIVLRASFL